MRLGWNALCKLGLLVVLFALSDKAGRSVVVALKPGEIWLEIPEVSARLEANTAGQISTFPLTFLKLHIARNSSEVDYGSIHTKINTEAADILMTTTGTEDGILCNFDLNRHGGFQFKPGRNSLEVNYLDHFKRIHYASFLIDRGVAPPTHWQAAAEKPLRLQGQKYAVVVGIGNYKNAGAGLVNLRYAERDAADFRSFLLSPQGGSFPKDNVLTLLNEDATNEQLRTALFTFLSKPRPDDFVVIYLAGHGSPDPNDSRNLYFLTYDTDVDNMGGTAFPMFQLQEVYERVIKARRVVTFVDSCHSFGVSGEKNLGGPHNNLINQYIQKFASNGERAVLTASNTSELSFEDAKWGGGHGVFTYFLLQGLNNGADRNHDGTVTVAELSGYLREHVSGATDGRQNPQAIIGGVGNIPVSTVGVQVGALGGGIEQVATAGALKSNR